MSHRGKNVIYWGIIIILSILVFSIGYNYLFAQSKEVSVAKKFINKLYSKDMVYESEDLDTMSFTSNKINDINNPGEFHTVNSRDFGIDLDNEFNIIGFKNKVCKVGDVKLSQEEALVIAKKYLDEIYDGEVLFEKFIEDEATVLPYYTLYFTKYLNGYPFYNDLIVVNIDKERGTLDGYSNIATLKEPRKVKIKIDEEEAEKRALEESVSYSKDTKISDKTIMAYYNNKEKSKTELCYVITLDGISVDGTAARWKYFVSTEKGDIINVIKDSIMESTISK